MTKRLNVGMGELKISDNPEVTLLALGLGSCVGVILYDPFRRIAAMLHIVLPYSRGRSSDDQRRFRFADTAIPQAILLLKSKGASPLRLRAAIAGGAAMFNFGNATHINIGKDNVAAVQHQLQLARIPIVAQDTGGETSRTLIFELATAEVKLKRPGGQELLLANLSAPLRRAA